MPLYSRLMPKQTSSLDKNVIQVFTRNLRNLDEDLAAHRLVLRDFYRKNNIPESQLENAIGQAKLSGVVQTYLRNKYDNPLKAFLETLDRSGMANALATMFQAWHKQRSID